MTFDWATSSNSAQHSQRFDTDQTGMNDRFDVTTCIVITMITHFVWISVFVWTGIKDTMSKKNLK